MQKSDRKKKTNHTKLSSNHPSIFEALVQIQNEADHDTYKKEETYFQQQQDLRQREEDYRTAPSVGGRSFDYGYRRNEVRERRR